MSNVIKQTQESWDAGFRAAYYGEQWTDSHGFDRLSYSSGWVEGTAKRKGFPSRYEIGSDLKVIEVPVTSTNR